MIKSFIFSTTLQVALVKRASDHCKGTMEIDSTGIIAFDGAKCEYGALECRGSRQGCDPVGA
jgi:hypothetical protein